MPRGAPLRSFRLPVLRDLQTITLASIWGERFHTTRSHELIHVLHGQALITFRGRSFRVGTGDTFVIPQGVSHKDVSAEAGAYRVLMAFFDWHGHEQLVRDLSPAALLRLPAGAKSHLQMMMKELEGEHAGEAAEAGERMRTILLEILLALARYARPALRPPPDAKRLLARERRRRLVADVRAYLLAHCAETIGLEALAEQHDVSPFHLSRCFTQELGLSLTDLLTTIRVERAKELLKDGAASVKAVAAQVGYGDANYFAKVFRRTTGLSPTEYQARGKVAPR
jgi:AraC-like DNA-binding protein